ncbi:hypothetical protein AtNW77_Chr1g0004951 [Arabidopsis thaliana]
MFWLYIIDTVDTSISQFTPHTQTNHSSLFYFFLKVKLTMADHNNTPPFDLTKLDHYIKYQPREEAEDFFVHVEVKVLGKGSSPLEISFSTSVYEFVWEDEDCYELVELYEFFTEDAGIDAFEAQFLVNDLILYVNKTTRPLDEDFTGVFKLMAEVTLKPVQLNHAGSQKTESQQP